MNRSNKAALALLSLVFSAACASGPPSRSHAASILEDYADNEDVTKRPRFHVSLHPEAAVTAGLVTEDPPNKYWPDAPTSYTVVASDDSMLFPPGWVRPSFFNLLSSLSQQAEKDGTILFTSITTEVDVRPREVRRRLESPRSGLESRDERLLVARPVRLKPPTVAVAG